MNGCVLVIHAVTLIAFVSNCAQAAIGGGDTVAAIDTYGLHTVNKAAVLEAAALHVGDAVPDAMRIKSIVEKLQAIPGVEKAAVAVIRTPRSGAPVGTPGQPIVYIGIHEAGRPAAVFRAAPDSDVAMPDEIVATYREFERTLHESMRQGNFSEDDSQGYALMGDEAARAVQKKFVPLANRYCELVIEVLQTANSAKQREMAAWVAGYASNKRQAAAELAAATRDPDDRVRNSAMRGLSVLLNYAQTHRELVIEAPIDWYLDMLESLEWTDRNKAMAVLDGLTARGDEAVLAQLRGRSLPALVEMARWTADGHALMAFLLVARIANLTDREAFEAWQNGKREEIIDRAVKRDSNEK